MATLDTTVSKDLTTIYGITTANSVQAQGLIAIDPSPSDSIGSRQSDLIFVGSSSTVATQSDAAIAIDGGAANSGANPVAMGRIRVEKLTADAVTAAGDDEAKMILQINDDQDNLGSLLDAVSLTPAGMNLQQGANETNYTIAKTTATGDLILSNNGNTGITIDSSGNTTIAALSQANLTLSGDGTTAWIDSNGTANTTLQFRVESFPLVNIVDGQGATRDLLTITSNDADNTINAETSLILAAGGTDVFTATSSSVSIGSGAVPVTVAGDLIVSGTTTTVNSTTSSFEDPLLDFSLPSASQALTPSSGYKYQLTTAQIAALSAYDGTTSLSNISYTYAAGAGDTARELTVTSYSGNVSATEIVGWTAIVLSGTTVVAMGLVAATTTDTVIKVNASTAVVDAVDSFDLASSGLYVIPGRYNMSIYDDTTQKYVLGIGHPVTSPLNSPTISGYQDLTIGNVLELAGLKTSTIQWNKGIADTNDRGNLEVVDGGDTVIARFVNNASTFQVDKIESKAGSGTVLDVNGIAVTTSGSFAEFDDTLPYDFQISSTSKVQITSNGLHLPTGSNFTADDNATTFTVDQDGTPATIIQIGKGADADQKDNGLLVKSGYSIAFEGETNDTAAWQIRVTGNADASTLEFRRYNATSTDFGGADSLRSTIS